MYKYYRWNPLLLLEIMLWIPLKTAVFFFSSLLHKLYIFIHAFWPVTFQDFNKAIELKPKIGRNEYGEAMKAFNKAIELNPQFAEAYRNRGLGRILMGDKIKGCADLSRATELNDSTSFTLIKQYCK